MPDLYFGPPAADDYCAYRYLQPGRRCPNHVDFHVKIPDGRGGDWRKARAACAEHLPVVIWQMQQDHAGYGGQYLLCASPLSQGH